MYGALNNIPHEVIEAARIDGAGAGADRAAHPAADAAQVDRPTWLILSFAAGTQLFVEPQLLSQASHGVVPNDYSLNQLAYQFAFKQNNFNGSAAISVMLLVVALCLRRVLRRRGGLFERD